MPENDEQEFIHKIIFDELTLGQIHHGSRKQLMAIIDRLLGKGADGVILGCTELTLIIGQKDATIPLFDTTDLHAKAAVEAALLK